MIYAALTRRRGALLISEFLCWSRGRGGGVAAAAASGRSGDRFSVDTREHLAGRAAASKCVLCFRPSVRQSGRRSLALGPPHVHLSYISGVTPLWPRPGRVPGDLVTPAADHRRRRRRECTGSTRPNPGVRSPRARPQLLDPSFSTVHRPSVAAAGGGGGDAAAAAEKPRGFSTGDQHTQDGTHFASTGQESVAGKSVRLFCVDWNVQS